MPPPPWRRGSTSSNLLDARDEGLSQRQVADALGRTVGEIYRMLACLVDRGYVGIDDRAIATTSARSCSSWRTVIRRCNAS
ncbi:MAG: helix-turn-helix domain-containing protein [Planctomycetota bacterium]